MTIMLDHVLVFCKTKMKVCFGGIEANGVIKFDACILD